MRQIRLRHTGKKSLDSSTLKPPLAAATAAGAAEAAANASGKQQQEQVSPGPLSEREGATNSDSSGKAGYSSTASEGGGEVLKVSPGFAMAAEEEGDGESLPIDIQVVDLNRMFKDSMRKVERILKEGCFFR